MMSSFTSEQFLTWNMVKKVRRGQLVQKWGGQWTGRSTFRSLSRARLTTLEYVL